jgi:cell division septum initiation protein DivIVA
VDRTDRTKSGKTQQSDPGAHVGTAVERYVEALLEDVSARAASVEQEARRRAEQAQAEARRLLEEAREDADRIRKSARKDASRMRQQEAERAAKVAERAHARLAKHAAAAEQELLALVTGLRRDADNLEREAQEGAQGPAD